MAPHRRHTDRGYEEELAEIRRRLLLMAGRVEHMIDQAVRAFVQRDAALARETIALDREVNQDEVEIDAHCLEVLARRQPMASDLRFLTLALKMVVDLERIGDLAVNICERAIDMAEMEPLIGLDGIRELGASARQMVHDAIQAFVESDASLARHVIELDDRVDELYHQVFRKVLEQMIADQRTIQRGIHVQSAAKFLERIGDHATNLAEEVVFYVEGRDIRHPGKRSGAPQPSS